jgi:hypothetical protein
MFADAIRVCQACEVDPAGGCGSLHLQRAPARDSMHLKLQCRRLLAAGLRCDQKSLFQQRSMRDVMRCVRYRQATRKHAVFPVCTCASALVLGHLLIATLIPNACAWKYLRCILALLTMVEDVNDQVPGMAAGET